MRFVFIIGLIIALCSGCLLVLGFQDLIMQNWLVGGLETILGFLGLFLFVNLAILSRS